jgi:3-oxoacyl-[acyl-carrier-protein] synthase III
MATPGIGYLDYYIPDQTLPVEGFLAQLEDKDIPVLFPGKAEFGDFIDNVLRLDSIRIEEQMGETEMLEDLIQKMFDEQVVEPADVQLIILLFEDKIEGKKNPGHFLQYKFGMSNATILNLSGNHCANLDVAIGLAARLCQGETRNILILSVTKKQSPEGRVVGTYGILGDGAALAIVRREDKVLDLKDQVMIAKGMLYEADMTKNNTLVHTRYIRKSVNEILRRNSLAAADIDKVVIQNANPLLQLQTLTEMNFDPKSVFTENIGRYGHLDTIDLVVNLHGVIGLPCSREGARILTIGLGWAGTYVATLFEIPRT